MSTESKKGPPLSTDDDARRARRKRRQTWPIRRYALGEEPSDNLSAHTTASERLAMVWPLTLLSWRLAGRPIPDYRRVDMPGRVIRSEASD